MSKNSINNIAYVHTGDWPSDSPSFSFVTYNALGMASKFENCYLCIKKNPNESVADIIRNYFNTSVPENLSVFRFESNSLLSLNYFYHKKVVNKLEELIKKGKLEVIITRNPIFLKSLLLLKKKYGTKIFFETHDFYADLTQRDDINSRSKRRLSEYENKYIPQISGLLCLQNSQKKLYESKFPSANIYLLRTGLKEIQFDNSKKKYLTYVGSLDEHKGIQQLIKSLKLTRTKPELLIIGGKSKNEIDYFKKIINENYDLERVTFTGWIDKKKMGEYLKQTAVGIIPLTDTFFNRYLTSPLKLFDCYSFCIPVIATDLPTTRELVIDGKTGLFFKDTDISDIANKIDKLFGTPGLIDNMRFEVKKYAEDFLWEKRAEKLKRILEEN